LLAAAVVAETLAAVVALEDTEIHLVESRPVAGHRRNQMLM